VLAKSAYRLAGGRAEGRDRSHLFAFSGARVETIRTEGTAEERRPGGAWLG